MKMKTIKSTLTQWPNEQQIR